MLAVVARMSAGRLFGCHFLSVFGAFKFHHSAPYLDMFKKTQCKKKYIYAAEPPLSRFFRLLAVAGPVQ